MSLTAGTICRINKSFGPFSSGTLVRVIESNKGITNVRLVSSANAKFRQNMEAHGIDYRAFKISTELLTPRRYRIGK